MPADPAGLLTITQAAAHLGISRQRLHVLIQAGRLPVVPVGPYRLIEPTALAAFQRQAPGRPKGRKA